MRSLKFSLVLALAGASQFAAADLISGFEAGLTGWQFIGDVSTQTAAIGLQPKVGNSMAFVTTMCDRNNVQGIQCATTTNEHPYSGVSSPGADVARQFLGLPAQEAAFFAAMPPNAGAEGKGESGAMKIKFFASAAGTISLDWNRIGADPDTAYMSVWSDDGSSRTNKWIYTSASGLPFQQSGVDLCARYYFDGSTNRCASFQEDLLNVETGWQTASITVDGPGWYWLGIGLGEVLEGTMPTVLAVDNVQFTADAVDLPEPGTLALVAAGVFGAWRGRSAQARKAG